MRERLEEHLRDAVTALLVEAGDDGAVPGIAVEAPRQEEHGDFACNAALVLAKRHVQLQALICTSQLMFNCETLVVFVAYRRTPSAPRMHRAVYARRTNPAVAWRS